MYTKELKKNLKVCLHCGYHLSMNSKERLSAFLDEGSFEEFDEYMVSENPLNFPDYLEKIEKDRLKSKINEAVVTGSGSVNGNKVIVAIMDSTFRMGSMGSVVGEKLHVQLKLQTKGPSRLLFLLHQVEQGCKKVH